MSRDSAAVLAQVSAMQHLLRRERPEALENLRDDALAELSTWPDVQIRLVPEVAASSAGCSVAGSYQPAERPPALCVSASTSRRRRQFTVLHEFGHHLQATDLGLGGAVINATDDRFEDDVCDSFAASILLPDESVSRFFGSRTPTASDIVALYQSSSASRAACVVRAVQRLDTFGAIVLYDDSGIVSFAAAKGSVYPPARGSDQSGTALVQAALRDPGRGDGLPFTAEATTIRYRSGHASGPLYGQAAWCDGYLVAVLVEDNAPWLRFSPTRSDGPRPEAEDAECEVCGAGFAATARCDRCREPRCPSGHCSCTRVREQRCDRCFMALAPARFPAGGGTTCLDCL